MAAGDGIAEAAEPKPGAGGHSDDAEELAGPGRLHPPMRNKTGGQDNPTSEDAQVGHDPDEAQGKSRVGVDSAFDPLFHFAGHFDLAPVQKQEAQIEHEDKAGQLHDRLHFGAGEEGGESGEGQRAVDDFHCDRAETDHQGPEQPSPRSFVHDGEVNRPDRHGEEKTAQKSG